MTKKTKGPLDFAVEEIEIVKLDIGGREDGLFPGHDLLSPYAWDADDCVRLLVRVLKDPLGPGDPTGVIYAGQCKDGLSFTMDREPAITPGSDFFEAGGVEALVGLAASLPADLPAAVFVVLHVPSPGASALPGILSRHGSGVTSVRSTIT